MPSSSTFYTNGKAKESSVCTWAPDPLGNEAPHEVGTVFTPVRASECMDLWSKKKNVIKFSHLEAGGLRCEKQTDEVKTQRPQWEEHHSLGLFFPEAELQTYPEKTEVLWSLKIIHWSTMLQARVRKECGETVSYKAMPSAKEWDSHHCKQGAVLSWSL